MRRDNEYTLWSRSLKRFNCLIQEENYVSIFQFWVVACGRPIHLMYLLTNDSMFAHKSFIGSGELGISHVSERPSGKFWRRTHRLFVAWVSTISYWINWYLNNGAYKEKPCMHRCIMVPIYQSKKIQICGFLFLTKKWHSHHDLLGG